MSEPNVDELLGIDPADPVARRAGEAVGAMFALIAGLVAVRKARGMSVAEVAEAIGKTPQEVSDFETMSSDPHLSMVRRYSVAVGARVSYKVSQ